MYITHVRVLWEVLLLTVKIVAAAVIALWTQISSLPCSYDGETEGVIAEKWKLHLSWCWLHCNTWSQMGVSTCVTLNHPLCSSVQSEYPLLWLIKHFYKTYYQNIWSDNKLFITLQYFLGIQSLTNLEYHLSVSCPFRFNIKVSLQYA